MVCNAISIFLNICQFSLGSIGHISLRTRFSQLTGGYGRGVCLRHTPGSSAAMPGLRSAADHTLTCPVALLLQLRYYATTINTCPEQTMTQPFVPQQRT